jgi:hypothetical protein
MTPSNPFNLKPKTIEDHNRQAEQALAFFLRDFPQTYRLLAGAVSRCLFADKPIT